MVDRAIYEATKKFMWDGQEYETEPDATTAAQAYQDKGFEVRQVTQAGKVWLYTRRLVTEVVVDG
jgi:hypothetical protein